jgi:predicted nucleic acid-binding protein
MSGRTAYLDTSAFLKLLKVEPESAALKRALISWESFASATLLRTETSRALRYSGHGHLLGAARQLMGTLHLVRMDEPLLDRAGDLPPEGMRSLDAVHLAAALSLGSDLGAVFTYDARLRDAAQAQGLPTEEPR